MSCDWGSRGEEGLALVAVGIDDWPRCGVGRRVVGSGSVAIGGCRLNGSFGGVGGK